jgi:LPXTG-motif cell wall-anchored protein
MTSQSAEAKEDVMKKAALSNLLALALAVVALTGAPAFADAPLVTITGTVVSMDGEVLVLSTDRGNLTFDLDKSTEMPATAIAVGNRITVSYDSDDKPEDKMDARKIVMAPATTTPTPTVTPTAPSTPAPQPTPSYDDTSDELPATASPLPLLGIVGLLALSGGLLLRKRTRR